MQDQREEQVRRLQENLQTIRKLAGWSIEDLGEKIGVTKQTISNLERGKTRLSLTQYIAIRAVLDYEAELRGADDILGKAVSILLDGDTSMPDYSQTRAAIETVAAASAGGAEKKALAAAFGSLIGGTGIAMGMAATAVPAMAVLGIGTWLGKVLTRETADRDTAQEQSESSTVPEGK